MRQALPRLGRQFFVTYGDTLLDFAPAEAIRRLEATGADGVMYVIRNEGRWDRSNVAFDGLRIEAYDKINVENRRFDWIDYGVSLLKAEAIAAHADGPFDLSDVVATLALQGRLAGCEATTRFYEIGTPEAVAEAETMFSSSAWRIGS